GEPPGDAVGVAAGAAGPEPIQPAGSASLEPAVESAGAAPFEPPGCEPAVESAEHRAPRRLQRDAVGVWRRVLVAGRLPDAQHKHALEPRAPPPPRELHSAAASQKPAVVRGADAAPAAGAEPVFLLHVGADAPALCQPGP
ncbi:hypothetical protein T484DRAFT_1877718, partial [Baffinella frigidus]